VRHKILHQLSKIHKYLKLHKILYLLTIYWLFIGISWLTLFTPFNECSGGLFLICFPPSLILILLPAIPGAALINTFAPFISHTFASWITHDENFTKMIFMSYGVTSLMIVLLGNAVRYLWKAAVKAKIKHGRG
jgi:hypothetical protein